MKLYSKEALLLGGIYGVLDVIFSFLGFVVISDILFCVFLISLGMLVFNKVPKFLMYIMKKYVKMSYYMCSIGWIPYFILVSAFVLFGLNFIGLVSQENVVFLSVVIAYGGLFFAFISIFVALYKRKNNS